MAPIEGKCACGAVRLEIVGEPRVAFYCHCDDCQKVHSATCVPVVMYSAGDVKVHGDVSTWQLRATPRTSCVACGTRLFAEVPALGVRGVVASVLPPGTFTPAFHIQCQHARLPVKDNLPHFKSFPAAFGGSDDVVDW
jgi:hypothetical protein